MRVPTVEGQRRDARSFRRGQQLRRAGGRLAHPAGRIHAALVLLGLLAHAALRRHFFGVETGPQGRAERRIAMGVKIERAHGQGVAGIGKPLRRPAKHRRRPAHHQRRGDADAKSSLRSPRVGAPPAAGSKAMARLSQPLSVRFGPG